MASFFGYGGQVGEWEGGPEELTGGGLKLRKACCPFEIVLLKIYFRFELKHYSCTLVTD